MAHQPAVRQRFRVVRYLFRYLSGRPLDGRLRTDSRFLHAGTRALTPTGHASRWAMLPGWKRAAVRLTIPPVLLGVLVALVAAFWPTAAVLAVAATAGAGYGTVHTIRGWTYRRQVVRPLVAALAPVAQLPPHVLGDRLELPTAKLEQVKVPLPDHWQGRVDQHKDIQRIVTQRLGGEWDMAPQTRRAPFYVHFTPTPAPPGRFWYGRGDLGEVVRQAILSSDQAHPLLGLGARVDPIFLDLEDEIAHLALSFGTGAGKSNTLCFLTGTMYYHGVRHVDVCDVKQVSLDPIKHLDGLRIHRSVDEIVAAVAGIKAEMDARYDVLRKNPTRQFPRWVLVLEEQNAFATLARIAWKQAGNKGRHPVWDDIALILTMGRQVNINVMAVYQRMDAEVSGGGTLRDQYGMKVLSRFSHQAWDMLVGTRPRGVSSNVTGRAISVMGGMQRQVQIPGVLIKEGNVVRAIPEFLELLASAVTVTASEYEQVSRVSPVTVTTPRFTLAEVSRQPWCTIKPNTLSQWKRRGKLHLPAGTDSWTEAEWRAALSLPVPGGDRA